MFDWNFRYQWLPLRPQDKAVENAPYELPAMTGGAYAIRRDLFFHLGGYDEKLIIWNGENYEMSLKLWLCSGGILQVPCSRVMHLMKLHTAHRYENQPFDFVARNLKRVAEVWLDDYKQYFYRGQLKMYENLDVGDLTKQFNKKKSLNCKPFQYYLDVVAPDMLLYFPTIPNRFAAGNIKAISTSRCLGFVDSVHQHIGFVDCSRKFDINFTLTLEKTIRLDNLNDQCLDGSLKFLNCYHQIFQTWKFDLAKRQIVHALSKKCLTSSDTNGTVFMESCKPDNSEQKWQWTFENKTALMDWENYGIKLS